MTLRYGLKLKTAAAETPVTTTEARAWLKDPNSAANNLIDALVRSATLRAEHETERALVTQDWELTLDRFPWDDWGGGFEGDVILLPRPPLQSIQSVKYYDADGVLQTMDAADYQIDIGGAPGRLSPAIDTDWPETQEGKLGAVVVHYRAGYGAAAAVPEDLKTAIKLLVAHWYQNREEVSPDGRSAGSPIPMGAAAILSGYWVGAV